VQLFLHDYGWGNSIKTGAGIVAIIYNFICISESDFGRFLGYFLDF